jgi:hypothetical protein
MNTLDPNYSSLNDKAAMPAVQPPPTPRGRDATMDEFDRAAERVAAAYRQALSELTDE